MIDEQEVLKQIHRLEAEADALRIERELAEYQAQQARHLAEQQAIVDALRAQEQAEQQEFRLAVEESEQNIRKWMRNPFLYIDQLGKWEE